jgi:methylmalonyl-CoA/ethylmalonyl-CoA epimerase
MAIPGIIGIDHVGIAVPDLEEAIDFYSKAFGAKVTHREVNAAQKVEEAMVRVGDSMIQLLAATDSGSAIARFLDQKGPGIQQLAYRVSDIEAAMRAVTELGMRLLYSTAQRGTAGSKINFIHPKDCGGVLVELVEPAD